MISENEIEKFENLGFKLINSFHRGIYGWQVFKSSDFTLSIGYDKCYYEADIKVNSEDKKSKPILQLIREITNDETYFESELSEISAPNKMSPKNVLKMLNEKLPDLRRHFINSNPY